MFRFVFIVIAIVIVLVGFDLIPILPSIISK
jgi:hypothetical protein